MTAKLKTKPRRKPKQRNPPRAGQLRPTISFRAHRAILERLDTLATRFDVTRNEVIERTLFLYLSERGDDVEAMLAQIGADDATFDLFA